MDLSKLAREYAGFSEDFKLVLREILQLEILQSLYQNNYLARMLILQGAAALRFCYAHERYIEHLRFTFMDERNFNAQILEDFKREFVSKIKSKYAMRAEFIELKSKSQGTAILFDTPQTPLQIHLTLTHAPSDSALKQTRKYYPKIHTPMTLRVASEKEILAHKLAALLLKDEIKDFWDIKTLKDHLVPSDYDLVRQKLEIYGCKDFKSACDRKYQFFLNTNLNADFEKEMPNFLDKENFEWCVQMNFFKDIKKAVLSEFIKLSKHLCGEIYYFNEIKR